MPHVRPISLAVASLGALAVLGCGRGDGSATVPAPTDPVAIFTDGPPSPGPIIIRIANAGSRVITTDPVDGLLAIHGEVSGLTECTDASTRVPVDIQIVRTPAEAQAINLLLEGHDNVVAIYDHGDPADLFPFDADKFCAFIDENVPVYEGRVFYRLNQGGGGNLLFFWEGSLTRTADAAPVHYVEQQYGVPGPDGTLRFLIEDIRLQSGPH